MLFKNIYVLIFINLFVFCILFLYILSKRAMPVIMSYAQVRTKRIGIEILRNVGIQEVNKKVNESSLYTIEKNNNGEIESIDFNTSVLNETLGIVAIEARKKLKSLEEGKGLPKEFYKDILDKKLNKGIIYEVPMGIGFGNPLLSSIGPKIPVKIEYAGNVALDVKTKVSQYGINSALIEVYIKVEVTQRTILPFQSKDTKITSEIPIIMKVVKGSVPNLYNSKNSYNLPIN